MVCEVYISEAFLRKEKNKKEEEGEGGGSGSRRESFCMKVGNYFEDLKLLSVQLSRVRKRMTHHYF